MLAAVTCCVPAPMRFVAVLLLCLCATTSWSQRFFNLTYDDVKIDSVLPHFGYSVSLGENYQDSVYDVQILYPEFIDATSIDVVRYKSLRSVGVKECGSVDNSLVDGTLPELPQIEQTVMTSRGKGFLSIGFCPLVYRSHHSSCS